MIKCPVCQHKEMDGTLFCSECGSRMWEIPTSTEDTRKFDTDVRRQTDQLGPLGAPAFAPPTGFAIRISGSSELLQLTGKVEYLLGRTDPKHHVRPDVDLAPYDGQQLGVSRRHANLVRTEAGLSIRDLGSTNGTAVNGKVLAANQEWPLRDGDEIRLGKLAFSIFFVTENGSST